MKTKIEQLRTALQAEKEREAQRAREKARKRQAKGAQLSRLIRSADTRTKILAGSWALDRAAKSEEFRAMMMRDLDRTWLSRDADRQLFDLPLLGEEEKARRDISFGKAGRKKEGGATAPHFDSSAAAPPQSVEQEVEAA